MSMHIFGTILTHRAVASNNRGEVEAGTVTTLQKVVRHGDLYSTVSAEAIRYALREVWVHNGEHAVDCGELNRPVPAEGREWKDPSFEDWERYMDNDVLGFMFETNNRRGVLEVSRAVSTTPWPGTVTNHFASVGAQPNPKNRIGNPNPIPYTVEVHDTRYQYTFAMTPAAFARDGLERTRKTLWAICNLRRVGGAHARFLYDFSPEMIVLRLTHDPAPRIMNCFVEDPERGSISLLPIVHRMSGSAGEEPDVAPAEVIVGGIADDAPARQQLAGVATEIKNGVKAAFTELMHRIEEQWNTESDSR